MKRNSQNLDVKIHQKTLFGILGLMFVFLVSFLSSSFTLQSTINNSASAESYTIGTTDYTISSTIEGTVDPSIRGSTTVTDSQDLIISTTCPSGYTVSISTDTKNGNLYKDANNSSAYYLASATGTISSPRALSDNQWGFNTNGSTSNFSKIPTTSSLIKTVNSESNMARTTFTYGFKTASNFVAGNYIGTVTYSIVPHPDCYKQLDKEFKSAFKSAGKTTTTGSDGKQYYKMQDMTGAICLKVPTPDKTVVDVPEIKLVDTRDSNVYTIRKLADGNCWMSQNLRLVGPMTLRTTDSDVKNNNFSVPFHQSYGFDFMDNNNQVGSMYGDSIDEDYGAHYSWYTATAGTGTSSISSGNATSSICPKGWQLPNATDKSYENLISTTYNVSSISKAQEAPLSFTLAGQFDQYGYIDTGYYGYYWTSGAHSSSEANNFRVGGGADITTTAYYYKFAGFSVRCVSRDDPPAQDSELSIALANANAEYQKASDGKNYYTMQSLNSYICDSVSTPARDETYAVPTAKLIDKRDGELYVVRKLADGNCWMTQNLRLGKTTSTITLTSSTSDVSSNFTLPRATSSSNPEGWYDSDTAYVHQHDNREIGNYYSYYAATAGTGGSNKTSGTATSSICPKGWKLPSADVQDKKSFLNLTSTYFVWMYSDINLSDWDKYNNFQHTGIMADVTIPPLNFTLAGSFLYYDGSTYDEGVSGTWWTDEIRNSYNVNAFYNGRDWSAGYDPGYNIIDIYEYGKNEGLSILCLVR